LGETTESIFIYREGNFGRFNFYYEYEYLIPLIRVESNYSEIEEDEFVFIRGIVINLSDVSNNIMYSESLFEHSIDFHQNMTREEILNFVSEFISNN